MLFKSKIESLIRPLTQKRCKVTLIEDAFGIPPSLQVRRVVVTGLGLATPLGVGVKEAWRALLHGDCGIKRLQAEDLSKASSLPEPLTANFTCQLGQSKAIRILLTKWSHGAQGHEVALDKLPSKVAAVVPRDQLEHAVSAAGLPAKGARFVNLAQLAALEALQVSLRCSCLLSCVLHFPTASAFQDLVFHIMPGATYHVSLMQYAPRHRHLHCHRTLLC